MPKVPAYSPKPSPDVGLVLRGVFADAGKDAVDAFRMGVSFDHVDENALAYAEDRGAELIRAIDDTTREGVRDLLAKAVEEGWSPQKFRGALEEAYEFSRGRAQMIARTEVAVAQNHGLLSTSKAAGFGHVQVFDGDGDDECAEADGQVWTIEEAEAAPTQHPNCVRSFSPVEAPDEEGEE